MTNRVYFDNEKKRIAVILEQSETVIVCNPEDSSHVYGFVTVQFVAKIFVIHFAYVKRSYQKLGIMRSLVEELYPLFGKHQTAITHINADVEHLREKYNLVFNPYITEVMS